MTDLFTQHDDQDDLRAAMQAQWQKDCAEIKRRRIIPDWKGEPKPLSKDKAALLEYLYEHGFLAWPKSPSKEKLAVARLIGYETKPARKIQEALDLGLDENTIAVANAKAVIDWCLAEGLIETRLYRGQEIYQMTQDGEYALEEWQIERELGFL